MLKLLNDSTNVWKRYGLAILVVGLAISARAVFVSLIGSNIPYITFFPAIIFAALYGGYRAGILAAILAMLFVLLWVNQSATFNITQVPDLVGYSIFISVSAIIIWLCESMRRASFEAASVNQKNTIILESVSDAFFAVDNEWRFIYINKKAEEFLKKTREQMIGRNLWETFPMAKGSVFDEMYNKALREGVPLSFEAQSTIDQRWMGVNAYPSAEGLSVYSQDITERKRSEKEREKILKSEQEARKTAETANRLKDEFLATVSHELRTPLNSILGWASVAKSAGFASEQNQNALEIIERNAKAQNKIIEDILDVSRIITGKLNLQMDSVKIAPIIESALDSVHLAADARRIKLLTDLEIGKDVLLIGDTSRLQQIMWNLLSNAVKFTPEGGEVEVALKIVGGNLEISVRDTGEGIESEFLPYVFERFRQAEGGSNRKYGGLGLGLAIVRHLTELHGGSVKVESQGKGMGTTFTVSLPADSAALVLNETSRIQPNKNDGKSFEVCNQLLTGKLILAVDDESDARELVSFILTNCGARVVTAESASDALEKMSKNFPDVIISDIGMPETDGFDLIRQVKEQYPQAKNLITIALTAYARKTDKLKAIAAGFDYHIPKPLEASQLVNKIRELIDEISLKR